MPRLDSTGVFAPGLLKLQRKIDDRTYTTILDFATDLKNVIADVLYSSTFEGEEDGQEISSGVNSPRTKLNVAKGQKALVKRIMKAIQAPLEDAIRKECQLSKSSPDAEIHRLTVIIDDILCSRNGIPGDEGLIDKLDSSMPNGVVNGESSGATDPSTTELSHKTMMSLRGGGRRTRSNSNTEESRSMNGMTSPPSAPSKQQRHQGTRSSSDSAQGGPDRPAANGGGVPWFLQSFQPDGTTIHEEQWTGRDLVRAMSEGLSDMDEEQLSGLVNGEGDKEMADADPEQATAEKASADAVKTPETRKKKASVSKRPRRRLR